MLLLSNAALGRILTCSLSISQQQRFNRLSITRSAPEGACFISHHVPNTYNSVGAEELPHGYLAVNTLDFTFELVPLHAAYLMTCHQLSVD